MPKKILLTPVIAQADSVSRLCANYAVACGRDGTEGCSSTKRLSVEEHRRSVQHPALNFLAYSELNQPLSDSVVSQFAQVI